VYKKFIFAILLHLPKSLKTLFSAMFRFLLLVNPYVYSLCGGKWVAFATMSTLWTYAHWENLPR
ncbi:MAG: hypothetical protein OSJ71_18075, partial [Acetatifactor sp.]|nr:hypothetical protein [Acetatifactor sp.]